MSITNELREYLLNHPPAHYADFSAIVDRIDAKYQLAEEERKAKDGEAWLRGYAECHAELMEGNEVIAADLEKAGWVRLPKDADGEPIHVGDLMKPKLFGETSFEVHSMRCDECGWEVTDRLGDRYEPSGLRHHREPTVEDVLREFTDAILEWSGKSGTVSETGTWSDVAAEYIERIRKVVEHEHERLSQER